ncbi:zinc finger protein 839 isoform X2 [Thamnophis elegans]|uniref:zinc finger protein 839 isoform X2 n=1 Tax=Thamnophis elegans TaxID=35005 RepID=UPI001376FF93|nr:zinc finger protein 839 isoform X2 [Thamnophis elegans]
MSSLGFRSDAAAAISEGSAPGPPGETPLTPVSEFPRWKPHRAPEAVAVGGVPGKLQDERLPPPVGKATQKAEDRRTAGPVVLPHGQSPACPPPLLLALSFNSETSASPSGSRLTTVGTLHSPSQPGQDGVQEMGSEAEHLALTGTLLAEMKTTHFQIESDQIKEKKSLELFSATALPKNIAGSQAVEKNSKPLGLSAINTEFFQIHTLTGTGSQHFFLCNSSKPTVQLLLPASLHPPGQVPLSKIIMHGQKHKSITKDREVSSNVSLVPSCSAKILVNEGKQPKEQKIKKSLKVTTRSGRVSRPPKYKVKDYKFIKTEDLADCHPSDSDDYSELSLEDDECNKVKEVCELFNTFNNDLRPKLFKCQNCEKSYIGKGGLSRHYRINPGHGHQESSESSSINRFSSMTQLECAEKANCESIHQPSSPLPITLALVSKNGLAAELEKNLQTESEQQSEISAEDRKSEAYSTHLGPGRRKRQRRSYQPKMANRSRCSTTFNSLDQLSSNSLSISAEHLSRFKRKEKLKELIQQCTNEEFMELVVPRMTTVVTVFEFLLMKAEKKCQTKATFPDIYREFEELHAMVKKMCQDYFNNSELKQPLEIKNHKVAESLGITDCCLEVPKIQTNSFPECTESTDQPILLHISGQKRAAEF